MGYNFQSYMPHQSYVRSPLPDNRLSQGHVARYISQTVDLIDLRGMCSYDVANGHEPAAYRPATIVMILFYAYSVGIAWSKNGEAPLTSDVAFPWRAPENRPDSRTISDFRCRPGI